MLHYLVVYSIRNRWSNPMQNQSVIRLNIIGNLFIIFLGLVYAVFSVVVSVVFFILLNK